MSSKNSNQINVPEARQAMNALKQEVASELGITLKPVSYTHLDVYKRQGQSKRGANVSPMPGRAAAVSFPEGCARRCRPEKCGRPACTALRQGTSKLPMSL